MGKKWALGVLLIGVEESNRINCFLDRFAKPFFILTILLVFISKFLDSSGVMYSMNNTFSIKIKQTFHFNNPHVPISKVKGIRMIGN